MAVSTASASDAASTPGAPSSERGRAQRVRKFALTPRLLLAPATIALIAALGFPLGWQLWTSTQRFGLAQQFGQPPEFVGLGNYVQIFSDPLVWSVIWRSLAFCAVNAALTLAIGVGLACLMSAVAKPVRLVLQIALLLAWAMPVVAAVTIWIWLFDWRRGVVNWLLTRMGFDFLGHNWLGSPATFFLVATIIVVWMSVPFVAFSVYAALTQVSGEVTEAAQMDGAGPGRRFVHIVLPLIRPVLMIVGLLQIIWDLRVFTQIRMLQDAGAPISETDLLGTFIYRMGVGSGDFGMASALSVFVLALTIAISAFYVVRLLREES